MTEEEKEKEKEQEQESRETGASAGEHESEEIASKEAARKSTDRMQSIAHVATRALVDFRIVAVVGSPDFAVLLDG